MFWSIARTGARPPSRPSSRWCAPRRAEPDAHPLESLPTDLFQGQVETGSPVKTRANVQPSLAAELRRRNHLRPLGMILGHLIGEALRRAAEDAVADRGEVFADIRLPDGRVDGRVELADGGGR